jgi:hypothetical protein
LNQLAQELFPWASEEARRWIETVDPGSVPIPREPRWDCPRLYGCPHTFQCNEPDWWGLCQVTDCDDARCRSCPDIFDLGRLIFKSWCAYVCVDGTKVTGLGVVAFSSFRNIQFGPRCYKW